MLLIAEGVTIVHMRGLLSAHMFIGLVLIPPVLLKLGSTGYRMVSYYAGSRSYRAKGPPLLPLRLMAPVLAASTVAVLTSGVLLLAAGHKSGLLLTIHKLSFIVFGVLFAVHLLAYLPRVVRSLRSDWTTARRRAVPGAGARANARRRRGGWGRGPRAGAAAKHPGLRRALGPAEIERHVVTVASPIIDGAASGTACTPSAIARSSIRRRSLTRRPR